MWILKNAAYLCNLNTVWLDKLLHGGLNQLWQVTINFIHAYAIQLVKAAAQQHIGTHQISFSQWLLITLHLYI